MRFTAAKQKRTSAFPSLLVSRTSREVTASACGVSISVWTFPFELTADRRIGLEYLVTIKPEEKIYLHFESESGKSFPHPANLKEDYKLYLYDLSDASHICFESKIISAFPSLLVSRTSREVLIRLILKKIISYIFMI